jgi:hypothetical protein
MKKLVEIMEMVKRIEADHQRGGTYLRDIKNHVDHGRGPHVRRQAQSGGETGSGKISYATYHNQCKLMRALMRCCCLMPSSVGY